MASVAPRLSLRPGLEGEVTIQSIEWDTWYLFVSDNDWEMITKKGDDAIRDWIDSQLTGRSCTVVLVGAATAGRKWIKYEIKKSWDDGKGLLGIFVHNLKNKDGEQSVKGRNPFEDFTVGPDKTEMSRIVKAYDPPFSTSTYVYDHIKENLFNWVEEAVKIREEHEAR